MHEQIYNDELIRQQQLKFFPGKMFDEDLIKQVQIEDLKNEYNLSAGTASTVHDASIIPPDRRHAMQVYYQQLKTKYPHMKAGRLARKTAEHFKIKLV